MEEEGFCVLFCSDRSIYIVYLWSVLVLATCSGGVCARERIWNNFSLQTHSLVPGSFLSGVDRPGKHPPLPTPRILVGYWGLFYMWLGTQSKWGGRQTRWRK